jgi:hypothetical protein
LRDLSVAPGVLLAASRDPDAKLTFITARSFGGAPAVVKIPTTAAAGAAVDAEARVLVALRRMALERLSSTVPRYVHSLPMDTAAAPALVSSALPGTPMSVDYNSWRHTSSPARVQNDLALAGRWLAQLQQLTAGPLRPVTWAAEVAQLLRGRWDGSAHLDEALARLAVADGHLSVHRVASTAVHGDFWFGNVLVSNGQVSGVVDWEAGDPAGSPLRDLARFALAYSLYLDRQVRPGHLVPGHRRLRRVGLAPGIRYALEDSGWFSTEIRRFLADGLDRLGLPRSLWYDVALTGIGEVAATANHSDFGTDHLAVLASLPAHPRRRAHPSRWTRRGTSRWS